MVKRNENAVVKVDNQSRYEENIWQQGGSNIPCEIFKFAEAIWN
jgi:hypothetical protein